MTRETKIGLLVGLAFIIVIGVLLSDHLTRSMAPPPAPLLGVTHNVLSSSALPGPRRDLAPPHLEGAGPRSTILVPDPNLMVGGQPTGPAADAARSRIIQATDTSQATADTPTSQAAQPLAGGQPLATFREHRAERGDTVSSMAARYLNSRSEASISSIVQLNPSLARDRNRVIAGEVYRIPMAVADRPNDSVPARPTPSGDAAAAPAPAERLYVVKPGDSLWKIAATQCNDASAAMVERIRQLNRDVLRNGDALQPNMKLRLPARPSAASQ